MTGHEYQILASRTSRNLTSQDHLLNGVLGLAGEAGEVADLLKKAYFQGHPLDFARVAGELGDIAWYLAEAATGLGYDLDDILAANINKLRKRYPDGFEAERSMHRASDDV